MEDSDFLVGSMYLVLILYMVITATISWIYGYRGMKYFFTLRIFMSNKTRIDKDLEEDQKLIGEVKDKAGTLLITSVMGIFANINIVFGLIIVLIAYHTTKNKTVEELQVYLEEHKGRLNKYRNILIGVLVATLIFGLVALWLLETLY